MRLTERMPSLTKLDREWLRFELSDGRICYVPADGFDKNDAALVEAEARRLVELEGLR